MDESYWKSGDTETLAEDWAIRKETVSDDPETPLSLSKCSHCDSEVEGIGTTENKKLYIWGCPTCDGDMLEIARAQPS